MYTLAFGTPLSWLFVTSSFSFVIDGSSGTAAASSPDFFDPCTCTGALSFAGPLPPVWLCGVDDEGGLEVAGGFEPDCATIRAGAQHTVIVRIPARRRAGAKPQEVSGLIAPQLYCNPARLSSTHTPRGRRSLRPARPQVARTRPKCPVHVSRSRSEAAAYLASPCRIIRLRSERSA